MDEKKRAKMLEFTDEETLELIEGYVAKMRQIGYVPEFIGETLALIMWAIDNPISP